MRYQPIRPSQSLVTAGRVFHLSPPEVPLLWQISHRLIRLSSGRVTLALIAVLTAFIVFVLPAQSEAARLAGHGAGSPDTSLWYSAGDLYRMAEAYGQDGRQAYVQARFTFDIVWPIVYVSGFTAALSWLLARLAAPVSRLRLLNLLPALGGLLDLGENVSTSMVMLRYPASTPVVDWLAPVFTLTKWACLGAAMVVLAGGLLLLAMRRFTRGRLV